jgi:hypothetical protein
LEEESSGVILRHEWAYDGTSLLRALQEEDPDTLEVPKVTKVYPYVAVSDVRAMISVYSYFDSLRRQYKTAEPEILKPEDDVEEGDRNLVVMGTPFDNRMIRSLEDQAHDEEFRGRGSLFLDADRLEGQKTMPNGDYRIWVHRRHQGSCCQTLINASVPAMLPVICDRLTSETLMQAVIAELYDRKTWSGFPPEFKIQFRVRMSDGGIRVRKVWVQQYIEMEDWIRHEDGTYSRPEPEGIKVDSDQPESSRLLRPIWPRPCLPTEAPAKMERSTANLQGSKPAVRMTLRGL